MHVRLCVCVCVCVCTCMQGYRYICLCAYVCVRVGVYVLIEQSVQLDWPSVPAYVPYVDKQQMSMCE